MDGVCTRAGESELSGTLAARTAELGETRAALSALREEHGALSASLAEARARLGHAESELGRHREAELASSSAHAAEKLATSSAHAAEKLATSSAHAAEAGEARAEATSLRDARDALSRALSDEEQAHGRTRQGFYEERLELRQRLEAADAEVAAKARELRAYADALQVRSPAFPRLLLLLPLTFSVLL